MKLLIPTDAALNILSNRLLELTHSTLPNKVWQQKTVIDIKEIFGPLTDQAIQIEHITMHSNIPSVYAEVANRGKQEAIGLLNSYIEQIKTYAQIERNERQAKEQLYEQMYNKLNAQHEKVLRSYEYLHEKYHDLQKLNESFTNENNRLVENTVQLDNITAKRLWTLIINLPMKHVWALIGILAAALAAAFFIGEFVQSAVPHK